MNDNISDVLTSSINKQVNGEESESFFRLKKWNFVYPLLLSVIVILVLIIALFNLQIAQGEAYYERSENNHLQIRKVYPNRGVIFDRNRKKLAENVPANDLFLITEEYVCRKNDECEEEGYWYKEKVKDTGRKLEEIIGDDWKKHALSTEEQDMYENLDDKVLDDLKEYSYLKSLRILNGLNNEQAIDLKVHMEELQGVYLQEGYKRHYIEDEAFAHLLGYISKVTADDLKNEKLNYIDYNDLIGRTGLEKQYDRELTGIKGEVAVEVDVEGNVVSGSKMEIAEVENGKSLYLTIDADLQSFAYELLKDSDQEFGADAGAFIIQEVNSGELITVASYPGYDNNLFVEGISSEQYKALLEDGRKIFTPRAIAGQQPPGSIFKTVLLASALDAGAISKDTKYLSSSNYELAGGVMFYEYGRKSYGWIDVKRALAVSSNIYPCETIRNWDYEEFVPYMERFGIGKKTGIDLPGEEEGRLPSPKNKVWLAENGFTWLDNIWYEPADSCYSVIGQGITTVTPIQAVNWTSTIANGGDVMKPHVGDKYIQFDSAVEESVESLIGEGYIKREDILSDSALSGVREGMIEATSNNGFIYPLRNHRLKIAAKTGTAEYGERNQEGKYEHTHAWIIGFFPYDDPQFAFVVFLEDGGQSVNATKLSRRFFDQIEIDKDGELRRRDK